MKEKRQAVLRWKFPPEGTEGKVHTVSEWPDGTLSCDCPAWVSKEVGGDRGCLHLNGVMVSPMTESRVGKPEPVVEPPASILAPPGTRRMRLGEEE